MLPKNYAIDIVSTNKNYAVDTLSALCTKSALGLKVHFELKVHFVFVCNLLTNQYENQ